MTDEGTSILVADPGYQSILRPIKGPGHSLIGRLKTEPVRGEGRFGNGDT